MNIGRLLKDENRWKDSNGVEQTTDVLDIRTLMFRKKFSFSVNKKKYPDGKVKPSSIAPDAPYMPDYEIWVNHSGRSPDTVKSDVIGEANVAKSESGLVYRKCKIKDILFPKGVIHFAIFELKNEDQKSAPNHTANISWNPPRVQNNNSSYNNQAAQPEYEKTTQVQPESTPIEQQQEEIPF